MRALVGMESTLLGLRRTNVGLLWWAADSEAPDWVSTARPFWGSGDVCTIHKIRQERRR